MKAMTCRALGGACDLAHHGAIADDVTQGPGPAPAGSGRRGRHHLRQGARCDEGRMEAPICGMGWCRDVKRRFAELLADSIPTE